MAISVFSYSYLGVESYIVEVEVDLSNGLPVFNIVGMGDLAISESKERIRSCFKNIGVDFPIKRVLVNLSPANIKKKGSHFDLSICVGIVANLGMVHNIKNLKKYLIIGEISLNGEVKSVKGVINATILAKENNFKGVIVPFENYNEARLIEGIDVIPVKSVVETLKILNEEIEIEDYVEKMKCEISAVQKNEEIERNEDFEEKLDFSDVKGQFLAKRAMEITAAGGHNIFLIGDPGSGKSMLAKRLVTILPDMSNEEIIETTKIYSVSGLLNEEKPIISKRPFRNPHHSSTQVSLVGGLSRVGEITLALNGVFFMDELAEFASKTLESLRQPLEDGKVTISRAAVSVVYPVKNITVAASNPTPSGYFRDDPLCIDSLREIKSYEKKFSGPFLDRMDLYVEMRRLKKEEIFSKEESESSEEKKKRVEKARKIQKKRFKTELLNANMSKRQIVKYCKIDKDTQQIFENAIEKMKLSARMHDKILKISRTIADLENSENIEMEHLLEALNYRKK